MANETENPELPSMNLDPRTISGNVPFSSSVCNSFIDSQNVAHIMLTICIHLYYISVTFTYRIFIAKLQSTSISQIKHMGNYIMLSFLSYMIRCILRCIIHNQYICGTCAVSGCSSFSRSGTICFFLDCMRE